MTAERNKEIARSPERLPPGHKLLLGKPPFLRKYNPESDTWVLEPVNEPVLREYLSIYSVLRDLLGEENIIVLWNKRAYHEALSFFGLDNFSLLPSLDPCLMETSSLKEDHLAWPRGAFTVISGEIFVNNHAWNIEPPEAKTSPLGEGGNVLVRGRAVLVTPDIWKKQKAEINKLREKGYRVGSMPFVEMPGTKPKFFIPAIKEAHIDGHASLIEGSDGGLSLVVARSYYHQGRLTKRRINRAAKAIGAELTEVDESVLPPLALNLIQFEDRSIIMTGSDNDGNELELALRSSVGADKVFTTDIPLRAITRSTMFGGIRCLTNILPPEIKLAEPESQKKPSDLKAG